MSAADEADAAEAAVRRFWDVARFRAKLTNLPSYLAPGSLEMVQPPAWSFGRTPEQADELLALVLAGTKTATAGAVAEYQAEGEQLPQRGSLGILLDGAGNPRALIATTDVEIVAFDDVDAEHALLEGEGDRSLAHWREVHEQFFTEGLAEGARFGGDLQVVLERFTVLYQR